MSDTTAPAVRGLDRAQEFFVDGLHAIQFHGVTTLFIPYRNVIRPGGACRVVPFVTRVPTGALAVIERQLFEFAKEHRLINGRNHDGTR